MLNRAKLPHLGVGGPKSKLNFPFGVRGYFNYEQFSKITQRHMARYSGQRP